MSPERWKQVEEIFSVAVDLPDDERARFVVERCGDDEELRAAVESLIRSDEAAGDFISVPAFDVRQVTAIERQAAALPTVEELPPMTGRRIGSYRVVREIGRGGMGAVYLAVRADDEFHKRVAIKLVKRGMDTDFILKRFRNERQILASLEHPHIAHLLDGGTTEDGLPYFVMEYIQGQPLDRYCDNARLSISERLRLFRRVCAAVSYAHVNLIIHRDIKPSNILVTADGAPKLLDFGIAKILNPEIAADTIEPTLTSMRMMTPKYASPEQLRGEPATPLSDQYSLGVLLYELLTGHHPFRLQNRAPHEIARLVCEEEPERPSAALNRQEEVEAIGESGSTVTLTPELISRNRSTGVDALRRELARGLDQVVMKAMRKEPHLRYPSVEAFAEDIGRFLDGAPVAAPAYFPSTTKTKEPQRVPAHRKSIAVLPFKLLHAADEDDTGDFIGVGLADALITRLSNVRDLAVRPTSSVMRFSRPADDPVSAGHQLAVEYVLDGHVLKAGERVRVTVQLIGVAQSAPLWAAHFEETYADILALHDSLSEQVTKALVPRLTGEERGQLSRRGTNSPDAYEAYLRGRYHWNSLTEEGFAKAIIYFTEAAAIDPSYAAPHSGIAEYYNWLGVFGVMPSRECFAASKEAATRAAALDPASAEAYAALGFAAHGQWDSHTAERHFQRAIELNPNYATTHLWYCLLLTSEGRFEESEREGLRALEVDPHSPGIAQNVGWTYYLARRYQESVEFNRKALDIEPNFVLSHFIQARAFAALGQFDEAVAAARRTVTLSGESPIMLACLGYVCALAGHDDEARTILARIDELARQRYVSPYHLALIHAALGEREAALARLDEAYHQGDTWLVWLKVEPALDTLRDDARFQSIVEGVWGASRHTQNFGARSSGALAPHTPPPSHGADSQAVQQTLRFSTSGMPGLRGVSVGAHSGPRPTDDEEAYQLYVAGRYFSTRRTAEGLRQAIERFERAVERDPSFALAHSEIADCYALLNWYAEPPPEGAWERAKSAALRAVEADEELAEAHASLGFVLAHYERDWAGAEREFRRAIELKPDNPVARRWHALNLAAMGRHDDALSEIRLAQEAAPRSPVIATAVAIVLFFARRFEEAVEQCKAALDLDPGSISTHIVLRWSYEQLGRFEDAIAVNEQERAFAGDTPTMRAKRAHVLAACGRTEEAREILDDILARRDEQWVTAYEIAVILSILGERDEAFKWLALAEEENAVGLIYIRVDPRLDNLRDDERFPLLLARVSRTKQEESQEDEASLHTSAHTSLSPASTSRATAAGAHVSRPPSTTTRPDAPRRLSPFALAAALVSVVFILAAGLGVYKLVFSEKTSAAVAFENAKPVKLTTVGNISSTAISPDGKIVAYVVDEAGRQGLWVRQVAVSNSVRLVPPADVYYRGLTFSHDGTYIYFVANEKGGGRADLFQVPSLGGSVKRLRSGVDGPVGVSRDGERLAFIVRDAQKGRETLYVANSEGGDEREVGVRLYPEHFSVYSAPAWSPDGKRLAVVAETLDSNGFFMKAVELNVETRAERPLAAERWSEITQMAWLSDGSGLMLTGNDGNASMTQLWHVSYPEGRALRLTHDLNDYRGLSISTDGQQLATVQSQTFTTVFLAPRNDFARPAQITTGAGRYVDLSWTPDGRVIFTSDASGNADVWEMAADGSDQTQLTAGAGRNYGPTTSPDGRYVFFHSNRSGKWQIWRMNRDGSNPVRVTSDDGNSNWAAVTPDGRWIVYEHTGSGSLTNLWRIPFDGGAPERLTFHLSLRPSVSPDGRHIAYWQKGDAPDAPWRIAVIPVDGSVEPRLFDVPQNDADGNSSIRWTGDSRAFVYTDFRDRATNLRLQPLEGGPARQITNSTRELFYSFDLARDGRLLLANGLTTSDVALFTDARR